MGCLQTREPTILKFSDNNSGIWGHFFNFYLLNKCLMTMLITIGPRKRVLSGGSSLQEPHLMSGRQRRCKTACGRHWCSDCTPSLHSSPPFFSLSDGNLLGLLIGAILNSLPESFKAKEASDRGLDNPMWSIAGWGRARLPSMEGRPSLRGQKKNRSGPHYGICTSLIQKSRL